MNPQGNPQGNIPTQEMNSLLSILVQQQQSQRYPPPGNQQSQQGVPNTGFPQQAAHQSTFPQRHQFQQAGNQQAYFQPGQFVQQPLMQPPQLQVNPPQSFMPGQQVFQQGQAAQATQIQLLQTLQQQQQQQNTGLSLNQPQTQGPAVNQQQFQGGAYPSAASGINLTPELIAELQNKIGLNTQQHSPDTSFYTSLQTTVPQSDCSSLLTQLQINPNQGSVSPNPKQQEPGGASGYTEMSGGPPVEPSDGSLELPAADIKSKTAIVEPYNSSSAEETSARTSISKPLPADHPLALQKEERKRKEMEKAKLKLVPLATDVHKKLRDGTEGKRCNILMAGMPGVGKSSLANSLLMALNEQGYREVAKRGYYGEGGKGGRSAITLTIQGHPLFHPKFFKENCPERKYQCQPLIFDCPGFIDNDDPNIKTLMKLIINGQLKENTNIANALETPLEELKATYKKVDRSREIDIVLVVHAATDPIPENLMDAVRNAAQADEEGARHVSLFGIITKLDKLEEKDENLPHIERAMAEQIGLLGIENRIFSTSLYCQEVLQGRKRDHEIDETLCQLWDAMLSAEHLGNESKSSWGMGMGGLLGMFKK